MRWLNLFRRSGRPTAPGANGGRELFFVECGPACGFRIQSHDRAELVPLVQHHLKGSHKTNVSEADAAAAIRRA